MYKYKLLSMNVIDRVSLQHYFMMMTDKKTNSQIQIATLDDIPSIIEIFMNAFVDGSDYFAQLFPPTTEGYAYLHKFYYNILSSSSDGARQTSQVLVARDMKGE